jgi:hypothetical protein
MRGINASDFLSEGCSSVQMHGIEVQTAARYKLPIIYLVINNGALGNVWLRANQYGRAAGGGHQPRSRCWNTTSWTDWQIFVPLHAAARGTARVIPARVRPSAGAPDAAFMAKHWSLHAARRTATTGRDHTAEAKAERQWLRALLSDVPSWGM